MGPLAALFLGASSDLKDASTLVADLSLRLLALQRAMKLERQREERAGGSSARPAAGAFGRCRRSAKAGRWRALTLLEERGGCHLAGPASGRSTQLAAPAPTASGAAPSLPPRPQTCRAMLPLSCPDVWLPRSAPNLAPCRACGLRGRALCQGALSRGWLDDKAAKAAASSSWGAARDLAWFLLSRFGHSPVPGSPFWRMC